MSASVLRGALNRYPGECPAAHAGGMGEDLGFGGEVAGFYHQYRRGYPAAVIDMLTGAFGLTGNDVVIDLGCGTGQLTLPIARRVQAVAGVDPEPDMLARARQAAAGQGVTNVSWLLGADSDIPAFAALLGGRRAGAVTIAQALHWMRYRELIPALIPLLRPGGGIAVVTNGTPMWLQDSAWSQALRGFLDQWQGSSPSNTCGTDDASQQRYRDAMTEAGLDVTEIRYDYTDELDFDHLVGGVFSALPAQRLPPPGQRAAFADQIRRAVTPHAPFIEPVPVRMLIGRVPEPTGRVLACERGWWRSAGNLIRPGGRRLRPGAARSAGSGARLASTRELRGRGRPRRRHGAFHPGAATQEQAGHRRRARRPDARRAGGPVARRPRRRGPGRGHPGS